MMIIDDLYFYRARRSVRPGKENPPLIVDADREQPGTVAFERFQPVARQCRQISQVRRRVQPIKAYHGLPREAGELPDMTSRGKPLGALVPIADDHYPGG